MKRNESQKTASKNPVINFVSKRQDFARRSKMKYITVAEAAEKWGITPRSVQIHCEKGNIPGVNLLGKAWRIPANAERPQRKPRAKSLPSDILEVLKSEKRGHISGGLYHQFQIDFTYNTNHMEGSRLTHEQTRWIFETQTVGDLPGDLPGDDIIETANHFRCIDLVIESADAALTELFKPPFQIFRGENRKKGYMYSEIIKFSVLLERAILRNKIFIDKLLKHDKNRQGC